jgi:hypothetical protein
VRPEDEAHGAHGREQVAVRDQHALGVARRAAGVHDARERVGRGRALRDGARHLCGVLRGAERAEGVEVHDVDVAARALDALEGGCFRDTVEEDVFQFRRAGDDSGEGGEEVGVGEDGGAVWFVQRVGEAVDAEGIVCGGDRGGDGGAGVVHHLP